MMPSIIRRLGPLVLTGFAWFWACALAAADTVRVATYNVDNYLEQKQGTREAKSAAAKAKVRESIRAVAPDVLALQEMGQTNALLELRASLKAEGLEYPYWEHVTGFDTNIFVAVLSRFPILARRPHSRENFLLRGRRFQISRGFAEVDIRIHPQYTLTVITAHLKSRRQIPEADEAELREQEALRLREIINARLTANPAANLVVLGDFNDVKSSRSTKILVGSGSLALIDTRPAERNGDTLKSTIPGFDPRNVTWTYFYGKEDAYERIDYILISRGLAREWDTSGTYVLSLPNWGVGSDHRPVVASFFTQDR